MEKDILKRLIEKYLEGNCTLEETNIVEKWYNSFDQQEIPLEFITPEEQLELKERLITQIRANITRLDDQSEPVVRRLFISKTLIYSLSGVAAIFLLVFGINFFNNSGAERAMTREVIVSNTTKTIQKIILVDGSTVWLNPQSKLKYSETFRADRRELQMDGEAFFEVTPDPKRPFIIYSGNVITRVWGTSFRVRALKNSPVEVSVVTGKVSVQLQHRDDSEVILLPYQKVTYHREVNVLKTAIEKKTSDMRMWQKSSMSFDNVKIEEVIKVLNAQFGVQINSTDDKLLAYVLNADFTDQSLPSILELLKKSLDLEYEINDQEIILIAKR